MRQVPYFLSTTRRRVGRLVLLVVWLVGGQGAMAQLSAPSGLIDLVPPQTVSEAQGALCFDLVRLDAIDRDLQVVIDRTEAFGGYDTATIDEDYEFTDVSTVLLADESRRRICPIRILEDTTLEDLESFAFNVVAFDANTREQTVRRSQVGIRDNDRVGPDLGVSISAQAGITQVFVRVHNLGTEPLSGIRLSVEGSLVLSDLERLCAELETQHSQPNRPSVCLLPDPLAPGETWDVVFHVPGAGKLASYWLAVSAVDDGARGPDIDASNNSTEVAVDESVENCTGPEGFFCGCFVWALHHAVGHARFVEDLVSAAKELRPRRAVQAVLEIGRFMQSGNALSTLYAVRNRMVETAGGRRGVDLYYRHTTEILELILSDVSLLATTLSVLDSWEEHIRAFAEGRDRDTRITQEQIDDLDRLLDRFASIASPGFAEAIGLERARFDLDSLIGSDVETAWQRLDRLSCVPEAGSLCLDGGRFAVDVSWTDFEGNQGVGQPIDLTTDTGAFWFFDDANLELLVKILDGRKINGAYWVFYGALSDVAFELTVTDTATSATKVYRNLSGQFASVGDTDAFPESQASGDSATFPSDAYRIAPMGALALPASAESQNGIGTCVSSLETLCLGDERFAIKVSWKDFEDGRGNGRSLPLTEDTGAFWFFDAQNLELMVKVLDATAINGHYWVFYGALSNVEYTLEVTDTVTGETATYSNSEGDFGSVGDIEALTDGN